MAPESTQPALWMASGDLVESLGAVDAVLFPETRGHSRKAGGVTESHGATRSPEQSLESGHLPSTGPL